jgi:hypothetical protein
MCAYGAFPAENAPWTHITAVAQLRPGDVPRAQPRRPEWATNGDVS